MADNVNPSRSKALSVTHVSWDLVGRGDAAEDEGVAVVACCRPRLAYALQQLPHAAVLPMLDEPVARAHVHRLGVQLEVLEQGGGRCVARERKGRGERGNMRRRKRGRKRRKVRMRSRKRGVGRRSSRKKRIKGEKSRERRKKKQRRKRGWKKGKL